VVGDDLMFFLGSSLFGVLIVSRPNVRDCTLKNKDLDSVVRNVLVLVVDMRRKLAIVWERL
jgi:hypothetical protein